MRTNPAYEEYDPRTVDVGELEEETEIREALSD